MIVNYSEPDIQSAVSSVRELISDREHFAYVLTFGCQQNEADSEKICGMLRDMSYTVTEDYKKADVVILNTCAIRDHAERKVLSIIGNFTKDGAMPIVGLVGCMAGESSVVERIKKSIHYVSFTAEPGMLHKIPELILSKLRESKRQFVFGTENTNVLEGVQSVRKSGHKAWVSVMHGCNNFCSYCIVPYVRGRERSRKSEKIIEECRELIESGYKEITLLGQNVNSYRDDMDFSELVGKIASIPGDFILRFMTSHPKDVSDSLIDAMREYTPKLAPAFHLPMQSGSDDILKKMNRTYNMEKYYNTVEKLRTAVPNIALTSDIIVGFPGETERDFLDTIDALKKIRFDMVYSFIYSVREGTVAARMEGHLDEKIKSERMQYLLEVQKEISHSVNERYVETVQRVLVDSKTKKGPNDVYTGRTLSNKLVHFQSAKDPTGTFKNIKINRAGAFDLFGAEIDEE